MLVARHRGEQFGEVGLENASDFIHRVKEKPLVVSIGAEVPFGEQCRRDGQARTQVALRVSRWVSSRKVSPEPAKPLGRDDRSGTVDGFVIVERLGGPRKVVTKLNEPRCSGIPA